MHAGECDVFHKWEEKYNTVKKKVPEGHSLWKYLAIVLGPSIPISANKKYNASICQNH